MIKLTRKSELWLSVLRIFQILVYLLGVFLVICIFFKINLIIIENNWPPSIEKMAELSQIIIAYAAIFAIGQYAVSYADIADRKTKSVLEFVKFFRESVIEKGDEINGYLKSKKISIPRIIIRKNTPTLEFNERKFYEKIYINQGVLIDQYFKMTIDHLGFEKLIISCLNSMEEFSIGILNTNSQDHEAVSSIKKPFVEIAEWLGVPLYFHIGMKNDHFFYLSDLYSYWKKDIGFIPLVEEDKSSAYQDKVKKYRNKN